MYEARGHDKEEKNNRKSKEVEYKVRDNYEWKTINIEKSKIIA